MGLLSRLLLGSGTLRSELRGELEQEGLVLLEEGRLCTLRYTHFKAPGRRFHGKVTVERGALAISERRVVVYCRSGGADLVNSEFTAPRLRAIGISLDGDDKVLFDVDYDELDVPNVSGRVALRVRTPNAARVVEEIEARITLDQSQ
jgi:hypothetical protein